MSKKVIFPDDPDAAKFVTGLSGWVSANGRYLGNDEGSEEAARYDGCTNYKCKECGRSTYKGWKICIECKHQKLIEKCAKSEKVVWDEETPIYSHTDDVFFYCLDDLVDYMDLNDDKRSVNELCLALCEKISLSPIDAEFYYSELPDNMFPPSSLLEAISEFNKKIKDIFVGWSPTKKWIEDPF